MSDARGINDDPMAAERAIYLAEQRAKRRSEYGYAGMDREAAYRTYMGLTCNNPPVPLEEREDRIAVLRELLAEEFTKSSAPEPTH